MERLRLEYGRFGEPGDVLKLVRRGRQPVGRGMIGVRMRMAPINPSDLIPIRGAYAHRIALPAVPGYEGVGIVDETGAGVPAALLGMRVLPLRGEGTWQERVVCPAEWAVPVPSDLPDAAACRLYINPLTALLLCGRILELPPGGTLAVNAGGSALGRLLAGFSRLYGYRLISLTRTDARRDRLLALGASHVIDSSAPDADGQLRRLAGPAGADAAIDCIGGAEGLRLLEAVRPGGMLASVGLLSGQSVNYGRLAPGRGIKYRLFHLRHWLEGATAAEWHSCFQLLIRLLRSGGLDMPPIEGCYDWADYKRAVAASETAGRSGKIVLTFGATNDA